jgi:DHA1 family bicyclomycin/chloramphenicol resistance-like MFS transporter
MTMSPVSTPADEAGDVHPHASRSLLGFGLALGILSAAGPLAVYLYLPALPEIARQLHAGERAVELSVTWYLVGLMAGQPVYGPLSDRFGRRPLLLSGLAIYIAGSIACAAATTIGGLVASRAIEGLGAGAAIAISPAVIRDMHTGHKAAQLLALRLLVVGVSPIAAPLIGAALMAAAPWTSIFWFAAAVGAAGLVATLLMPETRLAEARRATRLGRVAATYGKLVADTQFMAASFSVAAAQFVFTAYVSASSFVFIKLNHVAPWAYSLIFAVNAVSFVACAQLAPRLIKRMPPARLVRAAAAGQAIAGLVLLAETMSGTASTPALMAPLIVITGCYGLIGGPGTVLALQDHKAQAGTAAALLSSMQWAASALGSAAVAGFANGTALPMAASITLGGLAGCVAVRRLCVTTRLAP